MYAISWNICPKSNFLNALSGHLGLKNPINTGSQGMGAKMSFLVGCFSKIPKEQPFRSQNIN